MSSCTGSVMILVLSALHAAGALQSLHTGFEPATPLKARHQPTPGAGFLQRNGAGVYAGLADRVAHQRQARDHHVVGDGEVAGDADRAADPAAFADGGAARNTYAGRERAMRADAHVVADLDEVVEF